MAGSLRTMEGQGQDESLINRKEKEEKGKPIHDVTLDDDVYDATAAAAFGGVVVNLGGTSGSLTVHPFFLAMLSFLLWVCQLSALMYLRLDQPLTRGVKKNFEVGHHHHDHNEEEDVEAKLITGPLSASKLLMISICALMLFKELIGCLRLLTFLINPSTWIEVKRNDASDHGSMFHAACLMPCAVMAVMMKFSVAYLVLVDSVSIILVCLNVRDAIFNSLALTFIADLDSVFWVFLQKVCHLFMEGFEFEALRPSSKSRQSRQDRFKCFHIPEFFFRGKGAQRLELLVTFCLVIGIYARQLLVTVYALETDVLPVARDVCTLWKVLHGNSVAGFFLNLSMHFFVMNPADSIDKVADPDLGGYCGEKYDRMQTSDVFAMLWIYPITLICGSGAIALGLILPQFLKVIATSFKDYFRVGVEEVETDVQVDALQDQVDALTERLKALEERAMK